MTSFVFRSYGGIEQLEIDDPEDLCRIDELDKARWAATSAPIEQLFCDPTFLAYADLDKNNRIRVDEVREARRWLWARLRDRSRLPQKSEELLLSALDPTHPEAQKVKALAERLLLQLGAEPKDRIHLDQVRQFRASYSGRFPNGDGIVTAAQIADAPLAELVTTIVTSTGGAPDLSGAAGIRQADLDTWLDRVRRFLAWEERREDPSVLPLGGDTEAAADLVATLAPKVAQFFAQCALVTLEANAAARLQATPEQLARLDVNDPGAIDAWLAQAPLARPGPFAVLHLDGPLNPRYAASLRKLSRDVAPRALGLEGPVTALDPERWAALQAVFAPFNTWRAERPPGIPADASAEALRILLDGPLPDRLRALCAEDERVGEELVEFNNLEKLLLYQRWLMDLANNFVSFPSLFIPSERTLFEMGTLILDGRKLSLCVRVTDRAAHKKIAETSLMFLAYVEIVRKDGATEVKDQIAAAVTAGMRGGISVGKRGVFYDRDEREWDAIVVDVIQNPISLIEAMLAPFVRIRDSIAERLSTMIGSKATELETKAATTAAKPVVAVATPATPPAPGAAPAAAAAPAKPGEPAPNNLQALLVGGGVAFAAIGSSAAFIMQTISNIALLDALFGVLGLALSMAAVFGLLGWIKLRQRDISALLEACGWALNGRMRLTHYLSLLFTRRPGLPEGSVRKRQLPRNPRPLVVTVLVLILLALLGWLWIRPDLLGPWAPSLRKAVGAAEPAEPAAPAEPATPPAGGTAAAGSAPAAPAAPATAPPAPGAP